MLEKHEYNIFPDMADEKFKMLLSDLSDNGYDSSFPVYLYQNKILDGWNRYRACTELNILPEYVEFEGTDIEAIHFVMRTNKRRDLTSSQWACIAVEADDIVKKIKEDTEKQRRDKISEYRKTGETCQIIDESQKEETRSDEIIANMFNTNRQYVREAEKLKTEKPEIFAQVKSGEKTLTKIKQEEKEKHEEEIFEENIIPDYIEDLYFESLTFLGPIVDKAKNPTDLKILIKKLKLKLESWENDLTKKGE
jgi:hypothetical protein